VYEARGDLDRAIADFDEAVRLDPKNAAAHHNRGGGPTPFPWTVEVLGSGYTI
jgi:tetratricopeptide (TPR) repeat protein